MVSKKDKEGLEGIIIPDFVLSGEQSLKVVTGHVAACLEVMDSVFQSI
jgi:hypothetical protein